MFSSLSSFLFGSTSETDLAEAEMPQDELQFDAGLDSDGSVSDDSDDGSVCSDDSASSETRLGEQSDDWVLVDGQQSTSSGTC